jgi:hypothetical protein
MGHARVRLTILMNIEEEVICCRSVGTVENLVKSSLYCVRGKDVAPAFL